MAVANSGLHITAAWVDEVDNTPITVRKQIWNADQQLFETRVFTRYQISQSQLDHDLPWMTESLGPPGPGKTWWHQRSNGKQCYIWLSDSAATFWRLKTCDR